MSTLFMLFNFAVLIIGIMMVVQHKSKGWMTPPVLSGIAFVLLALPSAMAYVGM